MPADPADVLRRDREAAARFAEAAGRVRTRKVLEAANEQLAKRLRTAQGLSGPGRDSFTATQLKVTLAQVRAVLRPLQAGIASTALAAGAEGAEAQAASAMRYMRAAEEKYVGVGTRALPLDEARLFEEATSGARSSILRRIASDPDHPGNSGVLARYGTSVIGKFEQELQQRFVQSTPWDEVRDRLISQSAFLRGAPAHWAERIVRTEVMGAQNRANWETIRSANETLGDMCKILSCTFDDRTGADSIAVHGQVRKPEEAFESWFGAFQHPPDRPNDRAVVVPHRIAWPIPDYLKPRSDGEVSARWRLEGKKGSPPPRPLMTTIDLTLFGKPAEVAKAAQNDEQARQQQGQEAPPPEEQRAAAPEQAEEAPRAGAPGEEAPRREEPRVPRFRSEEARQAWARERLAEQPRDARVADDDVVLHRFPVASVGDQRVQDRIFELAAQLEKHEQRGEAPELRRVRISELTATHADVRSEHVLEDIHNPAAQAPIVVRRDGKLFVHRGIETVVARDLAGRRTIDAQVIDYDARKPFTPKLKPLPEVPKAGDIPIEKVAASEYLAHVQADRATARGPRARRRIDVDGVDKAAKVTRAIFGEEAPTLETLQKVWGSSEHQIALDSVTFRDNYGESVVRYGGTILKDGMEVGSIVRSFRRHGDGSLEVHHDYFRIDSKDDRGKGTGETMLRQAIHAYEHFGVNEITVDAAWVGQYTWATFGYNWDASTASSRRSMLSRYLVSRGGIAEARAAKIAEQVAPRAWDVAALDVDGITVMPHSEMAKKEPVRLGKAFMLESGMWSGTIKLDPEHETYQRAKKRLSL